MHYGPARAHPRVREMLSARSDLDQIIYKKTRSIDFTFEISIDDNVELYRTVLSKF